MHAPGTIVLCLAVFGTSAGIVSAQHDHAPSASAAPDAQGPAIPASRDGSGTSWQPDATPMHGAHFMRGAWMLMAHGNLFAGYQHEGGPRGDSQWIAPNWGMLMEQRALGAGVLVLRQMLTLEPLSVRPEGYPLLLQTGEAFRGQPIHDRQHPHDLFMELAADYTRPLASSLALQLYAAPVGEPALGPVAFPHRFSAASDPIAPRGHHWQDSTHVSFGVLTAGLLTRSLKVEASWFNGREPDDQRYDFDFGALDSFAGRVSFNPSPSWSFQASYGFLASPEELHPDGSVHRATASAMLQRPLGARGSLAVTAIYGRNDPSDEASTGSWLLEAQYVTAGGGNTWFGRAESGDRTGRDLVLPPPLEDDTFAIRCLSGGYARRIAAWKQIVLDVGARASVSFVDDGIEPFYGGGSPSGYMLFLHLYPADLASHSMHD